MTGDLYRQRQLQIAKILVIGTWAFAAGSFFAPLSGWGTGSPARALFWILLVAHTVEFFVFSRFYRSTGSSMAGHFFNNLVFGAIHHAQARRRHEGS